MLRFAPLLFLLVSGLSFSQTFQNRPDLTDPLLRTFVAEANVRGFEVSERLNQLTALKVEETDNYSAAFFYWTVNEKGIVIRPDAFNDPETNEALFKFLHEVGHLFGVRDCYKCKYNIMAGNYSQRAVYLSKDAHLKGWLLDNFFQRLKDPKADHNHY